MTKWKLGAAALFGVAIAIGCDSSTDSTTTTDTKTTTDSKSTTAEKPKAIKIGMIAKSSTNPVFLAAKTGAEAAAKELSASTGVAISVDWLTPPNEDGQEQAKRIAQAVAQGDNALLISCSDAAKVTGAINDAVDKGVLVMTFDSDAPDSKRFAFYGADDADCGKQVMDELAKINNGKGNVAILAGNPNAPNLQKRVKGVEDEAKKFPGIKIVGHFNHAETPGDATSEVLKDNQAHPEIDSWAMIGGWPLFATTLLTDLNPAKYKVVSVDCLPAELPYIDKGVVPVLLAQPVYEWGHFSVGMIVDKLVNHKDPASPITKMDLIRVDKSNLTDWAAKLKSWGMDVPAQYLTKK